MGVINVFGRILEVSSYLCIDQYAKKNRNIQ